MVTGECEAPGCRNPGEYLVKESDALGNRWLYLRRCGACILAGHRAETEEVFACRAAYDQRMALRRRATDKLTPDERQAVGL